MGAGRKTFSYDVDASANSSQKQVPYRDLEDKLGGVIFGCSRETFQECIETLTFGLPAGHWRYVQWVVPGLPIFLFNYNDRKLHGIFRATSEGGWEIRPEAWTSVTGRQKTAYPAQVEVEVWKRCPPIHEKQFGPVLQACYYQGNYFLFELKQAEAKHLISMFERMAGSTPTYAPAAGAAAPAPAAGAAERGAASVAITDSAHHSPDIEVDEDGWQVARTGKAKKAAPAPAPTTPSGPPANAWAKTFQAHETNGAGPSSASSGGSHHPRSASQQPSTPAQQAPAPAQQHAAAPPRPTLGGSRRPASGAASTGAAAPPSPATSPPPAAPGPSSQPAPAAAPRLPSPAAPQQAGPSSSSIPTAAVPPSSAPTGQQPQSQVAVRNGGAYDVEEAQDALARVALLDMALAQQLARHLYTLQMDNEDMKAGQAVVAQELVALRRELVSLNLAVQAPSAELTALAAAPAHTYHASAIAPSQPVATPLQDLYLIGGNDGNSWLDVVDVFTPSTRAWAAAAPMPLARGYGAAALAGGRSLLVMGGGNGAAWMNTTIRYDLDAGTWAEAAPMNHVRGSLAAVTLNGKVYAIGGGEPKVNLDTTEIYDPAQNVWIMGPRMKYQRFTTAAAVLAGAIHVAGGYDGTAYLKTMEMYDPREGKFKVVGDMHFKRGSQACTVAGGQLFAVGGWDAQQFLATVEAYEPRMQVWQLMPEMMAPRAYGAANAVDGVVYAIGGMNGPVHNDSIERLNLAAGRWEQVPLPDGVLSKRAFLTSCVVDWL